LKFADQNDVDVCYSVLHKEFVSEEEQWRIIIHTGVGKVIETNFEWKAVGSFFVVMRLLILPWYRSVSWRITGVEISRPPYSPDLVPGGFFTFPKRKSVLIENKIQGASVNRAILGKKRCCKIARFTDALSISGRRGYP
jgi:hypothetical protein